MFGLDSRALRITWTVFLFVLALTIIYLIRQPLLVFAAAIFVAYMLSPLVGLVERFLPRRRLIALAIVYLVIIGALVGIGFALIPQLVSQAASLVSRLPSLLSVSKLATLPLPEWLVPIRTQIIATANREASNLASSAMPFLQQAGTRLLSGVGLLLPMILIPILSFFFLKDAETITASLVSLFDARDRRSQLQGIVEEINVVLKNYIRALVILAIITFCMYSVFFKIVGLEYDLLLAGMAAFLEFIPVIGPVIALAVIVIVSIVTSSGSLLAIVIFWGVYRVFQDYVVNPYLMKSGLEIHPLLVLFGVLAGDRIGGIPGMFFSVPVIAMLKVVYTSVRSSRQLRSQPALRAKRQETPVSL